MPTFDKSEALDIRAAMREAEGQTDDAILAAATLTAKILKARRHPDFLPSDGQAALLKLHRAQSKLLEGSNDLLRVHNELSSIAIERAIADEDGTTPMMPVNPLTGAEADDAVTVKA